MPALPQSETSNLESEISSLKSRRRTLSLNGGPEARAPLNTENRKPFFGPEAHAPLKTENRKLFYGPEARAPLKTEN
jgi:hypothetical protein